MMKFACSNIPSPPRRIALSGAAHPAPGARRRRGRQAGRPPTEGLRGGFTLVELVVSISVGVIISGIAGSLIWNASRQRSEIAARGELIDMGGAALEVMLRYVREIPQDAGLAGEAQIDTASDSELRFGGVGFRLNAGAGALEITNNNGANWHPLVTDVSSFAFSYFDKADAALTSFPLLQADREQVRRIGLDMQLARSSQTARLRTAVYLRSFMNEGVTGVGP